MAIDLFRTIESRIAQRKRKKAEREPPGAAPRVVTERIAPPTEESINQTIKEFTIPAAAEDPAPVMRELGVGQVLKERYVIESLLGTGGMGAVYRALDRRRSDYAEIDPHVAIKILHEDAHVRSDAVSNLRREFYCAQALSHRSIVKVLELDADRGVDFFSMELIDGELLSGLMRRFRPRPLPRSYAWAVIREVGEGLAHAHERHVIHADIKPQNIMVTDSGELRILDFGASGESVRRSGSDAVQQNPSTALTPAYACCELLEGREPDVRDDLYALACLSYELLSGIHPFQHRRSTEARTLNLIPRRPPGLKARQWRALKVGLAWNRKDRTMSIKDWLRALNPGSEPLGAVPRPENHKTAPVSTGNASSTRLIGLLMVLVAGVTVWALRNRPGEEKGPSPASVDEAANLPKLEPPASIEAAATPAPQPAVAAHAVAATANRSAAAAPGAHAKPGQIAFETGTYKAHAGENFVEIRVHRTSISNVNTSFVWWTEPASAAAGVDYVAQARTTTSFLPGRGTASLFLKLIQNPARKKTAVFHVVLGDPSGGSSLGSISSASIVLPPK